MNDHPRPQEPEHLKCDVCMKEIPASVAQTSEGPDYILHFCGLECMERWRAQARQEQTRKP